MAVMVRRSGVSTMRWTGWGEFGSMYETKGSLYLSVSVPVTSGRSDIGIWIDSSHFETLASIMMKASPEETRRAFAMAILASEAPSAE